MAWRGDGRRAISGSADKTVRLWDVEVEGGRCLCIFEGHTDEVNSVAWSDDGRRALSGSSDKTVRLWDVEGGRCLRVFEGHTNEVRSVAWSGDGRYVYSVAINGVMRVWEVDEAVAELRHEGKAAEVEVQYTNAKVLLVGESGAGKTGISLVLAGKVWQPSDSTVGAWATQWKLPVDAGDGVEREIWLWDFGGQSDQRLIHQLYMDGAALAALVFDGQKEHLFDTLGQWDRDITRASRKGLTKLLVAGRVDAGGLRANKEQIETFARDHGFTGRLFETSAKTGANGCIPDLL